MGKAGLLFEDLAHQLEALLLNPFGGAHQDLLSVEPRPGLAHYVAKRLGGYCHQHQLRIGEHFLHITRGTYCRVDGVIRQITRITVFTVDLCRQFGVAQPLIHVGTIVGGNTCQRSAEAATAQHRYPHGFVCHIRLVNRLKRNHSSVTKKAPGWRGLN